MNFFTKSLNLKKNIFLWGERVSRWGGGGGGLE